MNQLALARSHSLEIFYVIISERRPLGSLMSPKYTDKDGLNGPALSVQCLESLLLESFACALK